MKPKAAELPPKSGYYWVKVAQIRYSGVSGVTEWVISDWFPVDYHVEDESFVEFYQRNNPNNIHHWDSDSEGHCVVDWQPLTPPADDPRWVHSDAGAKIGFEGYSGHESGEK